MCAHPTGLAGNSGLCERSADGASVVCAPPGSKYVASLYWAVMTLTSIGYGDIAATPTNVTEQLVCTMLMILGAIGWGLVLGTIVSNLANVDPEGDAFKKTMSELNTMMSREVRAKERIRGCFSFPPTRRRCLQTM